MFDFQHLADETVKLNKKEQELKAKAKAEFLAAPEMKLIVILIKTAPTLNDAMEALADLYMIGYATGQGDMAKILLERMKEREAKNG